MGAKLKRFLEFRGIPRFLVLLTAIPALAFASAATFSTALPVARDQLLVRFNSQVTFATRSFKGAQFPINIGYGLTSRLALFTNVNQGFGSSVQNSPLGRIDLSSGGSGDTLSYARYTLFRNDKPRSTFRIATLGGVFMPTGDNALRGERGLLPKSLQTGSGTFDPYGGITMGYNGIRYASAVDMTYRFNPISAVGISPGNQFRSDVQAEIKVYPIHMPEEGLPKLVVISFESNYTHDGHDRINRVLSGNSGGNVLKESLVLELSTLRWQIGLGAQLPVLQDLNGTGRMQQRSGYFLFFEYYLIAPSWRHRKTP